MVSFVMLSVFEEPLSDVGNKSGNPLADGAVVSISIDNGELGDDWFPAGSVITPVTDHVPSDNVGKSHDVATPTTYEHVTVVVPLVALIVTRSPFDPPVNDIVGVVSEVLLSVLDNPLSDDVARSGAPGVAGEVVSTVIDSALLAGD